MDQVTQQNAAMVEQATAASHSLAGEAAELAKLVAQFQTGAPTPGAATPGAAAPPNAGRQAAPRQAAAKSRIPAHAPIPKFTPAPGKAAVAEKAAAADNWDEF